MNKLKCLYISKACSTKRYDQLVRKTAFAAVKFNYSVERGLIKNDIDVYQFLLSDSSFKKSSEIIEDGIHICCGPLISNFKFFLKLFDMHLLFF